MMCVVYSSNADLLTNETLRKMAGIEAELEDPDGFGLENFTYKNRIIAETMFGHLEGTRFTGLTVRLFSNLWCTDHRF